MLMLMEQTNLFHLRILLAILLLPLLIPATPSEDRRRIFDDQTTLLNSRGKMMKRDNDLFKNWTADPSPGVCSWMGVSCTSNPNKRVQGLNLSGMGLHGTIPPELGRLSALVHLNLSNNSLEGDFPVAICNLSSLKFLDLSKNNLSGWIPEEVEQLKDLTHLSLANNQFNGSIPENINHLENLELLDLRSNNLSGEFPGKSLSNLSLTYFNVSNNKLKGKVPCGGNFTKFPKDAFESNDDLDCHCPPLYNARRTSLFVCGFMGISIGLLALGFAFVVLKRFLAAVNSYKKLHKATNGFHESNKLKPEGKFGSVYKGSLSRPQDEEEAAQKEIVVAVKVFKLEEIELKNFEAESKRLRGLGSPPNLTPVIDRCSLTSLAMVMGRGTYSEFKALVMKFMPEGSLEGCLHSGKCSQLDIKRRLQIMIGVASGLEYLHERGLLHGDLKPSNVLLDEDMVAHLSDFGITKSEKQQPPSDVEQDARPKKLHPTVYSDPEYWTKTSTKSDVYSFGIMLMETFTGKKPTDKMFGEELSLRDWVKEALYSSTVHQVVEAGLIREEEFKAKVVECVTSILKLAVEIVECSEELAADRIVVECSEELAADRMDIKYVVEKLKTIRDEQLPQTHR
ncbi:probable LRR receptor-like serine/threonine-protein kinase At4g37250 [Diospyros lotus]|uniref:probable LRR receptor-like serine/threonine-protein kinase At4g37250 n=1 Tax=Diospyros lotus TaxID=55363 RepID=UPI00225A9765|nr:probable LRR receptor-like serine/threonine-protein kinase At4g37250 [Diospyros lotus]